MNKILKLITGRLFLFVIAVIIQIIILTVTIIFLKDNYLFANIVFVLLSLGVLLYVVNKDINPSYKLAWAILIMLLPVLGGVFYLLFGNNKAGKKLEKALENGYFDNVTSSTLDLKSKNKLEESSKEAKRQSDYISNMTNSYPHTNTKVDYYPLGENKMQALLNDLRQAKHFIFMEYFIIEEGLFWNSILDILKQKVQEGVEVRLMYDDAGCVGTLPKDYDQKLRDMGIKVVVFNPLELKLDILVNNRDHRKITVIDGYIGYNGGINLADEYINHIKKHGHWKDTAIRLEGDGVINLTEMFLQVWCFHTNQPIDLKEYSPQKYHPEPFVGEGFVQSFSDTPLDNEAVGETVYMNIINSAKDYVYINTPYLVITNEMITALTTAAKSGVQVILTLPHIPDKWYVHTIARSYYPSLIKAGVRIFEYSPGFIHAKSFVCDDEIAVIGTINLDFRSLYLHFECATWMYQNKAILDMKHDYERTLALSEEITLDNLPYAKGIGKLVQSIIKVFSPLM
ncbi:MAG: cardiolipin synthase [Filifactoraceae bacterium]